MGKNEKGSALITSIMVMVLILGLTAAALTLTTGERTLVSYHTSSNQALYLAEAGAEVAIAQLKNNSSWSGISSSSPINLGNGEYWVTVSSNGQDRNVVANGKVGNTTKQVELTIQIGGTSVVSGDVFTKYVTFSNGKLTIDNTPKITGDIGSNDTITVNSSSPLINGKAYTPKVPVMDQWTWNKNAVTGGYVEANPAGTLNIAIPPMPSMAVPANSTNLTSISGFTTSTGGNTYTLAGGTYYYNGNYTSGNTLTAASGQAVTIYINGDLRLTKVSSTYGNIKADNLTIYATGNVILDNDSSIQATNNGTVKIYAGGNMQLTNNAVINGNDLTIQTNGSVNFNSNSSINKDSSSAITKIYSNGDIQFTNQFKMGGSAGLVVTSKTMNLNCSGDAKNTMFVAGSGRSEATNSVQIGGFYTTGSLGINSSPTINYNSSIVEILGLGSSGSGSGSFKVTAYKVI